MGLIWNMTVANYTSDDTNVYPVGIEVGRASAGGFTAAAAGTPLTYPRGWKMRHVQGKATSGTGSTSLPCAAPGNALFVSGGTFTISYLNGSSDYQCEGRIGERRLNKV